MIYKFVWLRSYYTISAAFNNSVNIYQSFCSIGPPLFSPSLPPPLLFCTIFNELPDLLCFFPSIRICWHVVIVMPVWGKGMSLAVYQEWISHVLPSKRPEVICCRIEGGQPWRGQIGLFYWEAIGKNNPFESYQAKRFCVFNEEGFFKKNLSVFKFFFLTFKKQPFDKYAR